MKRSILILMGLVAAALAAHVLLAQDFDKITVPLSDPAKPATLKASLISGGITVKVYSGKEITVEAKVREKKLNEEGLEIVKERELRKAREKYREVVNEKESKKDKAKGMQKLNVTSTGLSVEEDNNVVEVSAESWRRAIDLVIHVPKNTSLKLNCLNNGNILVDGVTGEMDVENLNGAINLQNVSGSVTAHALNKDITVFFNEINPKKVMSFSSMNGDIDVTLPQKTKATLSLKSDNGDIYSDFDISKHEMKTQVNREDKRTEGGKYKIVVDNAVQVLLNGGGSEMQFTNFNGDIYIRKGK